MTTEYQKQDICFCNRWASSPFMGDMENQSQVSEYLSNYLMEAGQNCYDINTRYELSL